MSAGQLWLRLGIFVAAQLILSWAFQPLPGRAFQWMNEGDVIAYAFAPLLVVLPTLLAALAAWFLPRPVSLTVTGRRSSWLWCLALFLCGALAYFTVTAPGQLADGWSDDRGASGVLIETWIWHLVGVPASLVQAFIALGVLAALARKVFPAAASGVFAAVALALPSLISRVAAALTGRRVVGENLAPFWAELLAQVGAIAVWALLYSGLALLLEGRTALARTVLGGLVLVPVSASMHPGVLNVTADLYSTFGHFAIYLLHSAFPLGLGVAAWICSSVRTRRSPGRTRAAAAAV